MAGPRIRTDIILYGVRRGNRAQRVKQPSKQIRETFGDLIRPLVRSYIMESLTRKKWRTVDENGINS